MPKFIRQYGNEKLATNKITLSDVAHVIKIK